MYRSKSDLSVKFQHPSAVTTSVTVSRYIEQLQWHNSIVCFSHICYKRMWDIWRSLLANTFSTFCTYVYDCQGNPSKRKRHLSRVVIPRLYHTLLMSFMPSRRNFSRCIALAKAKRRNIVLPM